MVPLIINVKRLAEELVQIQSELTFSRTKHLGFKDLTRLI